jgi:5'-3' exonuclease
VESKVTYRKLLVDGPYLAHRSFTAPYKLTTKDGRDSTMIHNFLISINSLRKKFNPEIIEVTWESHGTKSWRREMYSDYKPSKGVDDAFIYQFDSIQLILYLLKVKQYYAPKNEADDVIASLNDSGINIIFTKDKDIFQIVDETTHVFDGKKVFKKQDVIEKFGVEPKYIADLLAIAGDTSDNIIGLNGYGPKKSAQIIQSYQTIENWIKNENFTEETKNLLRINKKLTRLNSKCKPIELTFETNKTDVEILTNYELNRLKDKIHELRLLGKKKPKGVNLHDFF